MPLVTIAPVSRKGMRMLNLFYGMSETGKTLSALLMMAGMQPDPAKRGLLDTEGGERGRMYEDAIKGGFMYGALTAPFTPERYMEALRDFVDAGVTDLTVDSVSHAWFAAGGVLDMVEQATEKNDMAKWAKPKRRLGKLTGQWIGCGLNLTLCARGKQPMIEALDDRNRKVYVPGPVVPVVEKTLRYDMTVIAKMLGDGRFTVDRAEGGKCPGALRPIFAAHETINEEMGRKIAVWLGGQDFTNAKDRGLELDAREIASQGLAPYQAFWTGLTKDQRTRLAPHHGNLKSIAQTADDDAERARQEASQSDDGADLSDPFGSGKALPDGVHQVGNAAADSTEIA